MKIQIAITMTDTAEVNGLQPRVISGTKILSLELPVCGDEFLEAVDNLMRDNFMRSVTPLREAIVRKVEEVTEQMLKSGLSQPELPLEV